MVGLNNPFNIRNNKRNKWQGQNGSRRGFCNFIYLDYGIRAAAYLLMYSYRRIGIDTILGIVKRFAPPSENDTFAYIRFIVQSTNIHENVRITTQKDYVLILHAMAQMEGNPLPLEQIQYTLDYFKMQPLKIL